MPRRRRENFKEDFLDAVAAVPDERTPQQIQDAHIDRRQKRRVKDWYPIYPILTLRTKEVTCYPLYH